MTNHFLLRVGDSQNFINGTNRRIWAVNSKNKSFIKNVKPNDVLWFIQNKEKGNLYGGKIISVATYVSQNKREVGPLISITLNDDELGWDEKGSFCDVEIHYSNLYNVTDCGLFTGQKNQTTICNYDNIKDKLLVNLIVEYENIVKYSKATNAFIQGKRIKPPSGL